MLRQRARKAEHKEERRGAILAAAHEMYRDTPFAQITMAAVAERAGISKGTVYLYFETKEQLFLALLKEELSEWFDEIQASLADTSRAWDAARVAREIARSMIERPLLTRLQSMLESVLEHNIELERARGFKLWLLGRMRETGDLLESRLPFLKRGEGVAALLELRALLIGLGQMGDNAPVIRQVIDEDTSLEVFRVNLSIALPRAFTALMIGRERLAAESRPDARSADGSRI